VKQKLKVLDLFSGIGGFSLGLERTGGFETVAFCEIDPFCQKVLKKHWPDVPIYNDVRTLNYDGPVDVITGGYPCQPFSYAGKREGQNDDRHLWPAMFGLVEKHEPSVVIGENVDGHITMGLDSVLADLERRAYAARTFVIPACAVGARSERARTWVVAYSERNSIQGGAQISAERQLQSFEEQLAGLLQLSAWPSLSQARAYGSGDGLSRGVDIDKRNRALGNSVHPSIPQIIGHAILASESP
jgi:DNA (cytosine-5)-methyltransferase 1